MYQNTYQSRRRKQNRKPRRKQPGSFVERVLFGTDAFVTVPLSHYAALVASAEKTISRTKD